MCERGDNIPEADTEARPEGEPPRPRPGSYYYDDGTGYETYHPEADREESDDDKQHDEAPET